MKSGPSRSPQIGGAHWHLSSLKAILVVIAMALPLSAGAPGSWTISGSLNTARANHAAAMLPNGQALIVGGIGSSGTALTSAEIFNLSSNTSRLCRPDSRPASPA